MKNVKYYINTFMIYAIIGFLVETVMKHLFFHKMQNGSLNGPWIPIYGIGVILIIIAIKFINKLNIKNIYKNIFLFVFSMIALSLIELVGGVFLEKTTGKIFWQYDKLKFNIGHYIALEIALLWGIISLIIKYVLKPFTDKINKRIPNYITYLFFIIFLFDLSLNTIEKLLNL